MTSQVNLAGATLALCSGVPVFSQEILNMEVRVVLTVVNVNVKVNEQISIHLPAEIYLQCLFLTASTFRQAVHLKLLHLYAT